MEINKLEKNANIQLKKKKRCTIFDLIWKYNGNISKIAYATGKTRKTIYEKIKKEKRLEEALYQARETLVDLAENTLEEAILQGNVIAAIFVLKTKGKERGYTEKESIWGSQDKNITVNFINQDSKCKDEDTEKLISDQADIITEP